jgi:hypothetical protein
MASRKKAGAKSAAQDETQEPIVPIPTKASREADKQEPAPVFRVDLGEALPTRPIRTATDNE